jgi:hypothetical protein
MILPNDFDFTQGNLQDYVDCPYRFYLRYILRISWPALVVDKALEFEQRGQAGGRFHRLIQQYLLGVSQDRISELVDEDPLPDLREWWAGFLTHVPPWIKGQRWVETTLTTTLGGQRLVAKYDLILTDENGHLTIFDWKTSQRAPSKARLLTRIQTRLYRLVLFHASSTFFDNQSISPEKITMNYWFATHPQTPITLTYSKPEYERDQADLTALIEKICSSESADFVRTNELGHCRFCVYRSHCDRGVEAGDLEDFDLLDLAPEDMDAVIDFDDLPEIEF